MKCPDASSLLPRATAARPQPWASGGSSPGARVGPGAAGGDAAVGEAGAALSDPHPRYVYQSCVNPPHPSFVHQLCTPILKYTLDPPSGSLGRRYMHYGGDDDDDNEGVLSPRC